MSFLKIIILTLSMSACFASPPQGIIRSPKDPLKPHQILPPGTPLCENENCQYYSGITIPPKPVMDINATAVIASVHSVKNHIIIIQRVRISRLYRKCNYYPTSQNADCEEWKAQIITLSEEEIKLSIEKSRCMVGPHCKKSGDCYGGGASHCDNPARTRMIKASDPEFAKPESAWEKVFTQTCEMYWECYLSMVERPLVSKMEGGRVIYTTETEGMTIEIPYHNEKIVLVGNVYNLVKPMVDSLYRVNMSCLHHKGEKMCAATETANDIKKGEVFLLDSQCMSHSGGRFINIPCSLFPGETTKEDLYQKYFKDLSSAASLESLINVVVLILYENLQSNYNSMILRSQVQDTQSLLIKSIRASSSVNDFFLGNLLNTGGRTTWVNGSSFRFCPCAMQGSHKSNCDGRSSYQGGVWRTKSADDICLHPQETEWKSQNLSLLSANGELSLTYLEAPDLHTASSEGRLNPDKIIMPTELFSGDSKSVKSAWETVLFLSAINGIFDFIKEWSWIAAYFSAFIIVKNSSFGSRLTNR